MTISIPFNKSPVIETSMLYLNQVLNGGSPAMVFSQPSAHRGWNHDLMLLGYS